MISRRSLLLGGATLVVPRSVLARPARLNRTILCGDSHAYVMARAFRAVARAYQQPVAVEARGGSSVRQWLVKKWMQRLLRKYPDANTVLISLGTNCTRVERPKIASDVQTLVNIVNDWHYENTDDDEVFQGTAPVWLLPPPLEMDTKYLFDAVAQCEVFSFAPGPLKLESDGIHPTDTSCYKWAQKIADTLWS